MICVISCQTVLSSDLKTKPIAEGSMQWVWWNERKSSFAPPHLLKSIENLHFYLFRHVWRNRAGSGMARALLRQIISVV